MLVLHWRMPSGFRHLRDCLDATKRRKALLIFREIEGSGVDAESLPGRLARAVIEDVPEVTAAGSAEDLGAPHPEGRVVVEDDIAFDRPVKTRPAAIAVELRVRREDRRATRGAGIHAALVIEIELPRKWSFGPFLTQHMVLLGGEVLSPVCVRFVLHVLFHGRSIPRNVRLCRAVQSYFGRSAG